MDFVQLIIFLLFKYEFQYFCHNFQIIFFFYSYVTSLHFGQRNYRNYEFKSYISHSIVFQVVGVFPIKKKKKRHLLFKDVQHYWQAFSILKCVLSTACGELFFFHSSPLKKKTRTTNKVISVDVFSLLSERDKHFIRTLSSLFYRNQFGR